MHCVNHGHAFMASEGLDISSPFHQAEPQSSHICSKLAMLDSMSFLVLRYSILMARASLFLRPILFMGEGGVEVVSHLTALRVWQKPFSATGSHASTRVTLSSGDAGDSIMCQICSRFPSEL